MASPWTDAISGSAGTAGWTVAACLLLILIFRELAKKWITTATEKAVAAIYKRLSTARIFRKKALKRYKRAIRVNYGDLSILFLESRTISMEQVYVPLKTNNVRLSPSQVDAYDSVRSSARAVVIGAPGGGKSILMKHSMMVWAKGDDYSKIPVLVELHRCNGNEQELSSLILNQLQRDGLPGAERLMQHALDNGSLTLLLDGFDEVATAERVRVSRMIKDFAIRYNNCQIVITCRSAIYDGQLHPEFTDIFRISEFDERLIRRFLRSWPHMPSNESVEQLIGALRNTPKLMQLARNPLLLTMIAYLYSDVYDGKEQMLPHSRAEFYNEATDFLLRRLKSNINVYPAPVKRAILQRLALIGMDTPRDRDRLSLPRRRVIEAIKSLASELNFDPIQADALLREIVERSGLLLEIDGGEQFQFAHLTLQEYLSAMELLDKPQELLERYKADRTTWREPLKLWCGAISRDSSSVISAIFEMEPVLAFECLADTQHIEPDLVTRITRHFQDRFPNFEGTEFVSVVAAFGAVASDRRPRGRNIFNFLTELLSSNSTSEREAAMAALAATNLPEAASQLIAKVSDTTAGRRALVSMGDVAVESLKDFALRGSLSAIEDLAAIGTPAAAQALSELLWFSGEVAFYSAWYLATLVKNPEIEIALAHVSTPQGAGARHPTAAWVWDPFREESTKSMDIIIERISFLLSHGEFSPPEWNGGEMDTRLSVSISGVMISDALSRFNAQLSQGLRQKIRDMPIEYRPRMYYKDYLSSSSMRRRELLQILSDCIQPLSEPSSDNIDRLREIGEETVTAAELPKNVFYLLKAMNPAVAVALLKMLANVPPSAFSIRSWRKVRSAPNSYYQSWLRTSTVRIAATMLLIGWATWISISSTVTSNGPDVVLYAALSFYLMLSAAFRVRNQYHLKTFFVDFLAIRSNLQTHHYFAAFTSLAGPFASSLAVIGAGDRFGPIGFGAAFTFTITVYVLDIAVPERRLPVRNTFAALLRLNSSYATNRTSVIAD